MINLGDKKWGVKDSGLLAYKQVGSKFFNKDFDFTRSSDATYIDKNGVLQTAQLYNLIDYSQDFTQWTKIGTPTLTNNYGISPFGVQNSTRIQAVSGNRIYLSIGGSSSTYTYSIYAKGSGTLRIRENSGTYFLDISPTSEWVRYDYSFTASFTNIQIEFTATSDVEIYGAQLVEGTEPLDYQYTNGRVGIPRIDFSDGVGSLLLEPQRSNLLLQSNSFDTTWSNTYTTEEGGYDGIYGSSNAWKLSETTTNSVHILVQNTSSVSNYTFSIYIKKGTKDKVLLFDGTNNLGVKFNLETQSFNSFYGASINYNIEILPDGWARYSISSSNTSSSFRIYMLDDNYNLAFEGNILNNIYIQHAQVESGSYPTSIIETTTSQVTRTADVANNCGTEQDFNSEEGVLYLEIAALADDLSTRYISLSDESAANEIYIRYDSVSNRIVATVTVGGVANASFITTNYDIIDFNKIAVKYKENDFALWVNGVQIGTDTSGSIFSFNTLNTLKFIRGNDTLPFYGKVRSVKYFPTALTDEELEALTQG